MPFVIVRSPRSKPLTASENSAEYEIALPFVGSAALLDSVTVGANYSNRRKQLIDEGFVLTSNGHPANTPVPADYLYNPVSLSFIGIPGMVAFDSWRYYNDDNYTLTNGALWDPNRLTNSFVVHEKVLTGFVQANFNSGPVRGNAGVQIVRSDQLGEGYAAYNPGPGTVSAPISDGKASSEPISAP